MSAPPAFQQPLELARARLDLSQLPRAVAAAVWSGTDLGTTEHEVTPSGFDDLDSELPGGGWPCGGLTEVLQPQPSLCEWRLLAPVLRARVKAGGRIFLVGPPKRPNAGGLAMLGISTESLVWIAATTPAERLWTTEQLVKANPEGAVLAWLPQVRAEQLRRLQVHSQTCSCPVFLFRPEAALRETSPAPLRVIASLGQDWQISVDIPKRKGGPLARPVTLQAMPSSLERYLTPRLLQPSRLRAPLPLIIRAQSKTLVAVQSSKPPHGTSAREHKWQAAG
jgi:protein ImuA